MIVVDLDRSSTVLIPRFPQLGVGLADGEGAHAFTIGTLVHSALQIGMILAPPETEIPFK